MTGPRLLRFALALAAALVVMSSADDASAQYKNGQFGFEGGYMYLGGDAGLVEHGFLVGMRGAYKATDHWWFSARAAVGFRGEKSALSDNTVVIFHLVPVDVRYYFLTDRFRPFVGVSNVFHFLANQTVPGDVYWGPGAIGGVEIRMSRDLFLGFQLDAYYLIDIGSPDIPMVTSTVQLNFFL